jgi:tetratricopeptide (TPR) repeat protein
MILSNSFSVVRKRWAIPLIAIAVLASYAPALRDGFVWDDTALLLRDPLIRSWRLIPEGFQHFLFTDATASDFYRPIQRLTYTLEYWGFSLRPGIFHLTNILCHLAAAVAFLFFADELLRLFGTRDQLRKSAVALATLVWAIHPVHSAAVVYISGRADPLAAAFGFFGLYCGIRSLHENKRMAWLLTLAATAALVLSALSKEMGLIFPALWLVVLVLRKNWMALRNATGVAIFVSIVYLSLRLPAEHIPSPPPRTVIPPLVRPLIVARAVAEYAGLLAFPLQLRVDRDVETHPSGFGQASMSGAAWRELQTLLGILLVSGGLYWMVRARGDPTIFVCLLLAAVSYLPISGIFLLNATVAEHWIYLPSAFLFLAIFLTAGALLYEWRDQGHRIVLRALIIVVFVWIVFLAARTFVRTFDWKDQQTFLERTIAHGGDSARMLINLGGFELTQGKLEAASVHLQAALRKEPGQPFALLNLAAVAIKQNNFKLAHEVLADALRAPITEPKAQELLAVLEGKESGRINLLRLRLAARTGPPDWSIEKRYIKALDELGYTDRAITEVKSCLATQWYRAQSWQMLSELLAKVGRKDEAAQAHASAERYDVHLSTRPPAS